MTTSPTIIPSSRWFLAAPIILLKTAIIYTTTIDAFSVPSSPSIPPFSSPQTPEEVVQNQLFHYQTSNLPSAFSYNSPENKEATGTISDFETSLQTPPYNLLINHERADVLLEVIPDGMFHEDDTERDNYDSALCLVCIRPNREMNKKHPVWFWWELSRNIDDEDEEDVGEQWMVDCIIPDFEDLDFETDALSIEEFGEGDDDDELTIFWDVGGL
mmetsp:Transcript_19873/g.32575  ORF Transcript_19873/g.32575 Transcript_19873/m.32575 type:complete len:215 (-) Transcript_19873:39-683(-)